MSRTLAVRGGTGAPASGPARAGGGRASLPAGALGMFTAAVLSFCAPAPSVAAGPGPGVQACWLELSSSDMPGELGGAGLEHTKTWHSTVSAMLVRHPQGDVLIDAGFSADAAEQMKELPPTDRAFGLQVLAGAKGGLSITAALDRADEAPGRVSRLLVTHAHYDHIGGATLVQAPVYVSAVEAEWMAAQARHPTLVAPSLVAALQPRLRTLSYTSGPHLGFERSQDVYGDGTVVAVPLPGHTPGSQGVFVRAGGRTVFLIGDATDTLEAAERGLPKSAPIRDATDAEPSLADHAAQVVAAFHKAHPEVAIVPAHDRSAYLPLFGAPFGCVPADRSPR